VPGLKKTAVDNSGPPTPSTDGLRVGNSYKQSAADIIVVMRYDVTNDNHFFRLYKPIIGSEKTGFKIFIHEAERPNLFRLR
jgi:hypothetical protein